MRSILFLCVFLVLQTTAKAVVCKWDKNVPMGQWEGEATFGPPWKFKDLMTKKKPTIAVPTQLQVKMGMNKLILDTKLMISQYPNWMGHPWKAGVNFLPVVMFNTEAGFELKNLQQNTNIKFKYDGFDKIVGTWSGGPMPSPVKVVLRRVNAGGDLRSAGCKYTVAKGDTLYKIASEHRLSWQELWFNNQKNIGKNPDVLQCGQELNLGFNYAVKKGDTVSGIANLFGTTWQQLNKYNDLRSNDKSLTTGQEVCVVPQIANVVCNWDHVCQWDKFGECSVLDMAYYV